MKPQVNEDGTITISKDLYDELVSDSNFLNCLQSAGVDNWDGYEFAQDEFRERFALDD